jgi:hypothetical protein
LLKKTKNADSLLDIVDISVKPLENIKFLSRSVKYLSNAVTAESTNQIQFQVQGTHSNQNCSTEFEAILKVKQQNLEHLNPFKCTASLYTQSGKRLSYLDRLFGASVGFEGQHWFCEVKFATNSDVQIYDLIENHIDRPVGGGVSTQIEEFSRDNEPALIRIEVIIFISFFYYKVK